MLTFVLTIIFAFLFSFIFTIDASQATLYLGATTLANIPMFYVVFTSIIFGVLLASGTNVIKLIQSKLTIFGKDNDLKKLNRAAKELEEKIDKLEVEKTVLEEKLKPPQDRKSDNLR